MMTEQDILKAQRMAEKIVRKYHPGIPERDLEDLTQDVMVRIIARRDDYDPERGKLSAFVWWQATGVVRGRISRDETERRERRTLTWAPEPDALEEVIREIDGDRLMRLLSDYAQHRSDRELWVLLRRADGATYEEIGAEMGVTRERVRQMDARLMRQIRSHAPMRQILREYHDTY